MATLDFSRGRGEERGGVCGGGAFQANQTYTCWSTKPAVLDFHILTKPVTDFVTLSKSGRLQAGSILRRNRKKEKKKKQQNQAAGAMIKLPTTRNLTVSEWGELAGISASLFAPVGGHTVIREPASRRASEQAHGCHCAAALLVRVSTGR